MAVFRSKSKAKTNKGGFEDVKITAKDQNHYKMHTANIHDPILSAMNEAQPFEQAVDHTYDRRPSYLSNESAELKDIFGNRISQADISNPTRDRNERPLDTIRGFEYAVSGDASYRDQLETNRIGWGFHEDFPLHNLANAGDRQVGDNYDRPTINFTGGEQAVYSAANYSATSLKGDKKKKKKGLFGRKK